LPVKNASFQAICSTSTRGSFAAAASFANVIGGRKLMRPVNALLSDENHSVGVTCHTSRCWRARGPSTDEAAPHSSFVGSVTFVTLARLLTERYQ
jgi:hypothetical protein